MHALSSLSGKLALAHSGGHRGGRFDGYFVLSADVRANALAFAGERLQLIASPIVFTGQEAMVHCAAHADDEQKIAEATITLRLATT